MTNQKQQIMSAFIPQEDYDSESEYSYCTSDEQEMEQNSEMEEEEEELCEEEEYDEGYEYPSLEYEEQPVSNFNRMAFVDMSIPEINPWTKTNQQPLSNAPVVSLSDIMKDQKRIQEEEIKRKQESNKKRAKFQFNRAPKQESKGVSLLSGKKIIKNTDLRT